MVNINVFVILHTEFNIDLGFTFLSALLGACLVVICGAGHAVIRGRWLFYSRCWWSSQLLAGRCRSLGAGCGLPLAVFRACGCRLGSWVCLWWGLRDVAAGNMEGAHLVVDGGDGGMWLSCFVVQQLSWLVGSQGCSWWWVLQVGNVVAGCC